MWNFGEPELCGEALTLWTLEPLNLGEPELLRMERNFAEPGPRSRAAAPNHPETLLEEPQAFQAVGEK